MGRKIDMEVNGILVDQESESDALPGKAMFMIRYLHCYKIICVEATQRESRFRISYSILDP